IYPSFFWIDQAENGPVSCSRRVGRWQQAGLAGDGLMSELGSAARPLRVAIVGSGPSGLYSAEALFKSSATVSVDMYDRLPTPFGLVRGGVAPDHPKIKSVTRIYEKIADNPAFAFFGNVTVGKDIAVAELRRHYDAVLFSCGA